MVQFINIAINDFRLIFRDATLRVFLVMPVLVLLLVCYFLPYLEKTYPVTSDYIIYIVIMSCTQASTMYGFIYSVVFLDERDTEVAKIYGILPISKEGFILSRMLLPFVLSTLTTFIILLAQPLYPELSVTGNFVFSTLFGLLAPIMALAVASLANNKMEGMTWYKGLNLIVTLPLAAFFLPDWSYCFGVFPSFWAYMGMYALILKESYWLELGVGFIFSILLLIGLAKFFAKRHFA